MLFDIALVSLVCLLVVWVAYPLLVAALGRGRPHAVAAPRGSEPLVSIVIATRDDAATIEQRVLDCLQSDFPAGRLEVVVALDSGGGARVSDPPRLADPRVRLVAGDAPGGKAAALNAGVRASRGEILVFTDAHQRFRPDAVRHLAAAFADDRVGAASGCLDLPDAGERTLSERYWLFERWLRRSEGALHSPVGVTGAICAVRRTLWQPLPHGLILDDLFTPMRLVLDGHHVAFVDAARAVETRRVAAGHEYRRKVRTLTGVFQTCAWLPGILAPWRNPIWLQFVCHKLLRLLTPYWVLAVAVWLLAVGLEWAVAHVGAFTGLAGGTGVACVIASRHGGSRALRLVQRTLVWGGLLQTAIIVATVNGVRGRWDVWRV